MAEAFGVTHRTLHFYEEKGLLHAARMGPMRVYGEAQMRRMAVINACREIDMPIAAIQELLVALDGAAARRRPTGCSKRRFGRAAGSSPPSNRSCAARCSVSPSFSKKEPPAMQTRKMGTFISRRSKRNVSASWPKATPQHTSPG
ncbi:MerR family transcriptional regulator [Ensifer aridi]|uniref:MerR family transcriptional regulator n=1 Tax=Ensifer aridi TaxID=1708715 RepID=UPI001FCE05B3|nr:MerR family transcriptional regulator [Ensifer aridi]